MLEAQNRRVELVAFTITADRPNSSISFHDKNCITAILIPCLAHPPLTGDATTRLFADNNYLGSRTGIQGVRLTLTPPASGTALWLLRAAQLYAGAGLTSNGMDGGTPWPIGPKAVRRPRRNGFSGSRNPRTCADHGSNAASGGGNDRGARRTARAAMYRSHGCTGS